MSPSSSEPAVSAGTWWIAVCSALLLGLSVAQLLWLLWAYVPTHAAIFDGMAMSLSPGPKLAVSASNWLVRLFPLAVLAMVPLGALLVVGGTVVALKLNPRTSTVLRVLTAGGLTAALALFMASGFVVHSIQGVYRTAATSAWYQQSIRELDECRKEKRNAPQAAPSPASPR